MSSQPDMALTPADLRARIDALGLDTGAGHSVAAGVSGGPDSMALAWLLSHMPDAPAVEAVTVDHALRPEAAAEARAAGAQMQGWPRVRHSILTRAPGAADTRVMETARADRYRMLDAFCAGRGIRHLFIAHHRDDQAETVLFRIAKGSGLDGLAAMRPLTVLPSGVTICRPLLDVPRAALRATCRARGVPFIDDPSNGNPEYARPRLRAAEAALAAEGLTPERLARLASRMNRASEAFGFFCEKAEAETRRPAETDRIVFAYAALKNWPAEIRLRLLQKAAASLRPDAAYGPRLSLLEALEERLFSLSPPRRSTLAGCLFTVSVKNDTLEIGKERAG
jgi:tRNA(Ile)-lysidine synthase